MPNINSVECLDLARPDGEVAAEFKIEPAADDKFVDTNCAKCNLYGASPRQHESCSGPTGEFSNIVSINFPETPDPGDQQSALEATLNQAKCHINRRDMASKAVETYLFKKYEKFDKSPVPLYGRRPSQ